MFLVHRLCCHAVVFAFSWAALASSGERESTERYPKLPSETSAAWTAPP
jgi:hypothetical protein